MEALRKRKKVIDAIEKMQKEQKILDETVYMLYHSRYDSDKKISGDAISRIGRSKRKARRKPAFLRLCFDPIIYVVSCISKQFEANRLRD